jgi:hypothetical protein
MNYILLGDSQKILKYGFLTPALQEVKLALNCLQTGGFSKTSVLEMVDWTRPF